MTITRTLTCALALVASACNFAASANVVYVEAITHNGQRVIYFQQYDNAACGMDEEGFAHEDCHDYIVDQALDYGWDYEEAELLAEAVLTDCTQSTEDYPVSYCRYVGVPKVPSN